MTDAPDKIGFILISLALVLGAIVLLGFTLRFLMKKGWVRPGAAKSTPHLSVVGESYLDGKRRLVVVRFYDHDVLVALGDDVCVIDRYKWKDKNTHGD